MTSMACSMNASNNSNKVKLTFGFPSCKATCRILTLDCISVYLKIFLIIQSTLAVFLHSITIRTPSILDSSRISVTSASFSLLSSTILVTVFFLQIPQGISSNTIKILFFLSSVWYFPRSTTLPWPSLYAFIASA